jgi:hypothetical protein
LYVVGNVQFESIHQVFHSLETTHHSWEQEKDPCHRAIYHESTGDGCDHNTHFTAVKNCPLCHVVPANEQLLIDSKIPGRHRLVAIFDEKSNLNLIGSVINYLPARAPPLS